MKGKRKQHYNEIHDKNLSLNVTWVIIMKNVCTWHATHCLWWGNLKERAHLEDLSVDVSLVLKHTLNKYNGSVWTLCLLQNNTDV